MTEPPGNGKAGAPWQAISGPSEKFTDSKQNVARSAPRANFFGSDLKAIYSEEAEKAVLGCCLAQPNEVLQKVADQLLTSDFFVGAHREIFTAICTMFREERAVDVMTVHQWLVDRKLAEPVGSPGLLAELLNSFSSHLNIGSYTGTVLRESARRKVIAEAQERIRRAYEEPDAEEFHPMTGNLGLSARDALDLVNDADLIEPPILVGGLLHRGGMLLLGAASKSFKSWALIDLSIAIANGTTWWGLPCTQGRVLYADFELKPFFWRKRALEIAHQRGLNLNGIRVLNCRGHQAGVALRAIEREAKASAYDLIVADPTYSFLDGRDENSAGDVGQVMRELGAISESTGAALALSHHFAKGNASGKESQDRFSGSGVFARFPDALLTMTKHEEDNAFVIDSTIRNFAPMPSWVMRWQHPLIVRDDQLDPGKLKKAPGTFERKYSVAQLVEVLGAESLTFGQLVDKACDAFKMSKPTVNRLLKQGIEAGAIDKSNLLYRGVTVSRQ